MGLRSVLWALPAWLVVSSIGTAAPTSIVHDPVATVVAAALAEAESLLRIERDFDYDGRADLALATSDSCGNKLCSLELFLSRRDGGYTAVGTVDMLPFGYGLTRHRQGVGQLVTCHARGEQVTRVTHFVSQRGLHAIDSDPTGSCPPDAHYAWHECRLDAARRRGRCDWRPASWP